MSDNVSQDEATAGSTHASSVRILILAVLLAAAWVLWSGFFKPLLLGLGVLSCVLTLIVVRRMGYLDKDVFAFHYNYRLLGFWGWLGKEVVLSSFDVAREVLKPNVKVEPKVVKIDAQDLSQGRSGSAWKFHHADTGNPDSGCS